VTAAGRPDTETPEVTLPLAGSMRIRVSVRAAKDSAVVPEL